MKRIKIGLCTIIWIGVVIGSLCEYIIPSGSIQNLIAWLLIVAVLAVLWDSYNGIRIKEKTDGKKDM